MLALMAGTAIDTGQLITHLLISFLPIIINALLHAIMPSDPKLCRFLVARLDARCNGASGGLGDQSISLFTRRKGRSFASQFELVGMLTMFH